jgi:cell division septum initiation protein DivIVA
MPDESSAAEEHAIIQEVTAPLASLPADAVPEVSEADFPIVLRGYDRLAVDAYVKRTSQLVAELQATHSPEAAVRRALERVGEEVSGILQRAHDAAAQITAQSRSDAEDRLERARQEAMDITVEARRRLKDLDTETDRIWAERHRIVEDAQDLARQLLSLAEAAAERFPAADDEPDVTPFPDDRPTPAFNGDDTTGDYADDQPEFGGHEGEQSPHHANGEGPGDEFDGDVTEIMPPIVMPDEHEGS